MDLATFDHLQEGALPSDPQKSDEAQSSLNNDIQDAYKAFSSSPWGAKIGGFFGNVVKQVCISLSSPPDLAINLCRASPSITKPPRSLPKLARMPRKDLLISENPF